MKKEYLLLMVGLIIIWVLGFVLFMPDQQKPKQGISAEGASTSINK